MNVEAIVDWTIGLYGEATYKRDEMSALAGVALHVPDHGLMVEIGTFTGCSASILLQAAEGRGVHVLMLDPFAWMWDSNAEQILQGMLSKFTNFTLKRIPASRYKGPLAIDLLHIDGDHSKEHVDSDCSNYLPMLKSGGRAAFHDYRGLQPNPFVGMPEVVDQHTQGWKRVWHGGDHGLLIVEKP